MRGEGEWGHGRGREGRGGVREIGEIEETNKKGNREEQKGLGEGVGSHIMMVRGGSYMG